jgi:GntR family histidine utilization transcriptional repressor
MPAPKPSEARHTRIAEDIRQMILKGFWPPGRLLPKETDLATSYNVSRMTMNKVLTDLSKEGLLVRRRRSGTVVAQPRAQSAVMAINDIAQEVSALGLQHEWRLLSAEIRALTDRERHLLSLDIDAKNRKVLLLHGLHLAQAEAFCLEMRAINIDIVPDALAADFQTTVPGQWLLETMPFSSASHRIRAINALGQDAKLLDLPVGAACLEILRETQIGESWVTHVRLLYPGEVHQLVAQFSP